ncbi:MAG TPA: sulfite exporter TauE/SafE family protein, partial [Candidatus Sulfotelmatobacter sp.]|nr:sulfite exporter TauE/SafE family protein [Candidatus Sulfotelmatobacter sp.]
VTYQYRFNLALAAGLSLGVGFVSSLLGIGGGIIHVPLLTTFFAFPPHVATATSHFVLMIMAGAATATHAIHGDYQSFVRITVELAAGAMVGAPAGAALSRKVEGSSIIRLLAVALAVVGIRLLVLR